MATATGLQVLEVTDGGSANGGQDAWIELELFNGKNKVRQVFFVDREKFALIVQALLHFGGMARAEYLKRNPMAEANNQLAGGYAPPVSKVLGGVSTQPGIGVLTIQAGSAQRPVNFNVSANAGALRGLIATAQALLSDLESKNPPDPKLQIQ